MSTASSSHPTAQDPTIHDLFSLAGRTALITGGAGGLGIVLAAALLEAGAHVYCVDIMPDPSQDEWKVLVEKANASNVTVNYRSVDVTKAENVQTVFDEIEAAAAAPVRICIAAAGIQMQHPAIDFQTESVRRIIDINVVGVFNTAQAAARLMRKHGKGGSIILIASMSGSIANRDLYSAPYNASKAAVVQLARSFAVEWAEHGIRVNSLSPGYIKTPLVDALLKEKPELEERWADGNPMKRISEPWEYKASAVFLAGDSSSFFTGMDLRGDGGHAAW